MREKIKVINLMRNLAEPLVNEIHLCGRFYSLNDKGNYLNHCNIVNFMCTTAEFMGVEVNITKTHKGAQYIELTHKGIIYKERL